MNLTMTYHTSPILELVKSVAVSASFLVNCQPIKSAIPIPPIGKNIFEVKKSIESNMLRSPIGVI